MEQPIFSINEFWDKIILGGTNTLFLYKFGKKQLLKQTEFTKRFNLISGIEIFEDRIFVIDAADSAWLIKYNDKEGVFYEICDDLLPKYTTT